MGGESVVIKLGRGADAGGRESGTCFRAGQDMRHATCDHLLGRYIRRVCRHTYSTDN